MTKDDGRRGVCFRDWEIPELPPDWKWLTDRVQELKLSVMEDGQLTVLIDKNEIQPIRRNHLLCILRRDYIQAGKEFRGKRLDRLINLFIDAIIRLGEESLKSYQKGITEEIKVDVKEGFI